MDIVRLSDGLIRIVRRSFGSVDGFRLTLMKLGWELPPPDGLVDLSAFEAIINVIGRIEQQLATARARPGGKFTGEDGIALFGSLVDLIAACEAIGSLEITDIFPVAPSDLSEALSQAGRDFPQYIVMQIVTEELAGAAITMRALGILESVERNANPDNSLSIASAHETIRWDYIGQLVSDPIGHLSEFYGWDERSKPGVDREEFDHLLLFANLLPVLELLGLNVNLEPADPDIFEGFSDNPAEGGPPMAIRTRILHGVLADPATTYSLGFLLGPAAGANQRPVGLDLALYGQARLEAELATKGSARLSVEADAELNGPVGLRVTPQGIDPYLDLSAANIRSALVFDIGEDRPQPVFGGANAGLLHNGSVIAIGFGTQGADLEYIASASTALKLVIAPGEGDSFIGEILGDNQMEVDASIAMRWSSVDGFAFEGGVGFDVIVPVDMQLGPIFLTQIRVALQGGAEGLTVEGAVSGGLDIAVLAVSVDDIGLRAKVTPVEEGERGMLGPVDLALEFKPPKGMGMVIDAADLVTGGGYLYHDENLSEYGGVAEIGFLSLKLSAIGILTTRMPDGEEGWSLFLSVFSDFPPIQLAFGFTLNGVGGLVGLHRTFDDEALRERLLAGALDSIMFPQDPVANAPQIISDIRSVFPPSQGQFVFGAMLKLGWGTPSIVSLELGVIVELPDPIKIALLGQLGMILPKPDTTLIEINMDMFGVANLTEGTLKLDAVIRDSHIMGLITLSGAMAFRAEFGSRPNMLLSIGGFHPDFEPPPGVPQLGRMKAALPLGRYAAVELSGYVAVTSNSFQTGGHIDIWVKVAGLSAEGWFKFDALIQFSPFGFAFATQIGFCVSFKGATLLGVDVYLQVLGPAPWTLNGYAEVKILVFKKKLNVDLELGRESAIEVQSHDVAILLEAALEERDNWGFSEASAPLVTYAKRDQGTEPLDPRGKLTLHQKIVPLNMHIEKFGNGNVEGLDRFAFEQVEVGSETLQPDYIDEWFARGEFIDLSDDQRVSEPSFELFDGGAEFVAGGEEWGPAVNSPEGFDEIIVDAEANRREDVKRDQAKAKAVRERTAKESKQAKDVAAKSEAIKAAPTIPSMEVRKLKITPNVTPSVEVKKADARTSRMRNGKMRRSMVDPVKAQKVAGTATLAQTSERELVAPGRRIFR